MKQKRVSVLAGTRPEAAAEEGGELSYKVLIGSLAELLLGVLSNIGIYTTSVSRNRRAVPEEGRYQEKECPPTPG